VLFQAGSSGRGQQFAIKHSDIVFAIQPRLSEMRRFIQGLSQASVAAERAEAPKVVFGIQCILGGTETEARRKQADMLERVPIDAALSRMSGTLGIDFSKLDLDEPLGGKDTQAGRGMLQMLANLTGDGNATVRDAARVFGASTGMPQIVGTPQQVADQLETLWRESQCHGFNITPATNVRSVEDFVDQVVPLLQERGIFRREYASATLRGNLAN
jgi:alkanesulfonate monooxygenase SsuD/methylene tetrahydromethanopterin reductase-like flavin-dependent oxidoreductase (luciferase family)